MDRAAPQEFLPAALEVQDTPPSPTGRWLTGLLLLLFALGVGWASFGEVDIVVTAPGRVVPSGQVKLVQAPEAGSVLTILVGDGARVQAGQPLLLLDPTYADADELGIRQQLHDNAVESAWRRTLDRWLADGRGESLWPTLSRRFAAADQARAEALYSLHRSEITARFTSQERELAANLAEQDALRAQRDGAQATLAVLKQRVAAYKTLLDQQYGARVQYLEMLQQQTELERAIPVLQSREGALVETAAAIDARMRATLGEIRKANLLALAQLDSERIGLRQSARKLARHRQQLELVAPVAGTVQELAVHTVGAVVSPAQELMKVVPADAGMEVEALLQNKDVGFVREGQSAQVKIDTFNFTKYGLIDAKVLDISNDAVEDPRLGWVFRIRLLLDKDWVAVEGKRIRVSPGMAITAEVKTGRRRLIEFFLSPLLRYQQESVRER